MKAAVLEKLNEPLVVREGIEIPELTSGQVLVEVKYSGFCQSQVMEATGGRGDDPYLPHMLGHEGTGVVVKVSEDVKKVKVGDEVILGWIKGSGIDATPPKYKQGDRIINAGNVTTLNEMALVSENRLILLPEGISMKEGILFGCPLLTGAGIVFNQVQPEAGNSVVIWGLGGVGICAMMAALTYDDINLIVIDIEDSKLELAKEFGVKNVINPTKVDVSAQLKAMTGSETVDYCVEATGLSKVIEQAFGIIKRGGGKLIFASHPKAGDFISIDPFELICGKEIKGSWGGGSYPDRDVKLFAEKFIEKKIPLNKLLEKEYQLEDINSVIQDMLDRKVVRPLIKIQ